MGLLHSTFLILEGSFHVASMMDEDMILVEYLAHHKIALINLIIMAESLALRMLTIITDSQQLLAGQETITTHSRPQLITVQQEPEQVVMMLVVAALPA